MTRIVRPAPPELRREVAELDARLNRRREPRVRIEPSFPWFELVGCALVAAAIGASLAVML